MGLTYYNHGLHNYVQEKKRKGMDLNCREEKFWGDDFCQCKVHAYQPAARCSFATSSNTRENQSLGET